MKLRSILGYYPNKNFVETGTYQGDSVRLALDCGFREVYSIELSAPLHRDCEDRFKGDGRVHLYCGDSGSILESIIQGISSPITFWLDGHFHPGGKLRPDNPGQHEWGKSSADASWTPLVRELKAIKKHPIKEHVILIDDLREFPKDCYGGMSLISIQRLLTSINPNYNFRLHHGAAPDDILAAYP